MSQHDMLVEDSHDKKTLSGYVTGLLLSLILTILAFGIVSYKLFSVKYSYIFLAILAVTQLIVQAVCFLRLNASREGQWNLLPFIFSIFVIAVLVGGSLWIMYNLNYNMMN